MPEMLHIHDETDPQHFDPPPGKKTGLVPRNYNTHPLGCYSSVPRFTGKLYSDEDIQAAIKRKNADKSWLSDLRDKGLNGRAIPSRDQNGKGYCWAHSTVSGIILARVRDGQPYADLSAFAIACMIKGFQDEGGWNAESAEFAGKKGVPTADFWPQQSMSRSNDNPKTWENAAENKISLAFTDIQPNDDRALATHLIDDEPVMVDYNWWSHSICACKLISWNPLSILIWNSWGDSWSDNGMGVLSGSKASSDGMTGISIVKASPV